MNRYVPVMAVFLMLIGPVAAVPVTSAAIGDPVPLGGVAPGADIVYLFLTGPNLPVNGVRLDDISAPVISGDPSSFTRTSVDDYRWEYTWYTRTKGGVLDAGTYTIYIVTTPVGRRDLAGSEYATLMVSLGSPGLVILPEGGVTIRSSLQSEDSLPDGFPVGTSRIVPSGLLQANHTPDTRNGSDTGSINTLNVTGNDIHPEPSVTASPLSPLPTPPEKIPFPVIAFVSALGCTSGLEKLRRRSQKNVYE